MGELHDDGALTVVMSCPGEDSPGWWWPSSAEQKTARLSEPVMSDSTPSSTDPMVPMVDWRLSVDEQFSS